MMGRKLVSTALFEVGEWYNIYNGFPLLETECQ
jgi:hypothetical protein